MRVLHEVHLSSPPHSGLWAGYHFIPDAAEERLEIHKDLDRPQAVLSQSEGHGWIGEWEDKHQGLDVNSEER